jgi:hypothetical protein
MVATSLGERAQMKKNNPEAAALKFALMGLAGASIEWYDFFLYATAACRRSSRR